MPAARSALPSVAPVDIEGAAITPGQSESVIRTICFIRSGRNRDPGMAAADRVDLTVTFSSATTPFKVFSTKSGESSGMTRQFTVAAASCGNAFDACPPSSIVATQVVRSIEFQRGYSLATRRIASSELDFIHFSGRLRGGERRANVQVPG